ncbi:MAG: HupE/UreJ family protein [Pseudomonadales bacterium]
MRTAIGLLLVLLSASVWAHEVRPAYLQITEVNEGTEYDVLWKQPVLDNNRLPIDPVFPEGCELNDRQPPEVTAGALIHHWSTTCDLSSASIHISGLSLTLTDVMVRFDHADGSADNFILRPENPRVDFASDTAPTFSYLIIGVEHLVFGIDHVLFVVGLFLFIRQPIMLLKTITAFTVAHSITLALSVLEFVQLEQGPVEAIIALSIVFLARELAQDEAHRSALTQASPWIMAFIFGLLHGLGFAGALSDIGLPKDALWLALLLFNVGIELGQIAIIAVMAALAWLASRWTQSEHLVRTAAYGMGAVAVYWTIDRTLLLI